MRAAAAAALLAACAPLAPRAVIEEDFASPACLERFRFTDAEAWVWSDADGIGSLELAGDADYEPRVRSPRALALLEGVEVGVFELELDLLQTGREYGHRDLVLVFGYQSPERFYYVHLATTPDANAHNVFLVDGAPRRNLLPPQTTGFDWSRGWRRVTLERDPASGLIRVGADGLATPVFELHDRTLTRGLVGFGSFDDRGRFAGLRLRARD